MHYFFFLFCEKQHLPLDGDRTLDHFVLQKDADNQEQKIKSKHEKAQDFIHPPLAESDGEDDKEQHDEEEDNCTEQTIAADCHWCKAVNHSIQEPRKRKAVEKQKINLKHGRGIEMGTRNFLEALQTTARGSLHKVSYETLVMRT